MKINVSFLVIMVLLLSAPGCTPSYLYVPDPTVYMKKGFPDHDDTPTLTVLPFEGPSYYPEIGMYTAKLFYQKLLERHGSLTASLSQDPDWYEKVIYSGIRFHHSKSMILYLSPCNHTKYYLSILFYFKWLCI